MRDALFSCGLAARLIDGSSAFKLIEMLSEYSALLAAGLFFSGLLLVVRVLKREVRAFGGCLGMHRR